MMNYANYHANEHLIKLSFRMDHRKTVYDVEFKADNTERSTFETRTPRICQPRLCCA